MTDEFRSWALPAADDAFEELLASARLEQLGKGRSGAVLVAVDDAGAVPIVRTTTRYTAAAQPFRDIHHRLAEAVCRSGSLSCAFNNALLEHYTNAYSTMKRHSDQALDLAAESAIAIYSCYRHPRRPSRRLVVKPKAPNEIAFDIVLAHGTVVAFSLDANRRFTHTIALCERAPTNDWLGITFRQSKTFVRFVDEQPWLSDGEQLTLADEEQRHALLRMRRRENDETDFTYPSISYTLSETDLLPVAT